MNPSVKFFQVVQALSQCFRLFQSVVTHQRTETSPGQCHGEGRHGNWAEVEDSGIDVQWRESLNTSRK